MIKRFFNDLINQFDKLMINLITLTAGFAMLALVAVIIAWPIQLLWNECIVGMVNGTNPITIFKSMVLFVLIKIVFEIIRYKN